MTEALKGANSPTLTAQSCSEGDQRIAVRFVELAHQAGKFDLIKILWQGLYGPEAVFFLDYIHKGATL